MKKVFNVLVVIMALVFLISGCGYDSTSASDAPIPQETTPAETEPSVAGQPASDELTTAADIFKGLPRFDFRSGAGGWNTEVIIHEDGTFTGYFHDSDMGDVGDEYPNGTLYECNFSGNFYNAKEINEFEYSFEIENLTIEGTKGEEKIVDGVRVITSDPYGFDNAGEFRLYLPGISVDELPLAFINWVRSPLGWEEVPTTLSCYGLYNIDGEQGFFSSISIE